MSIGDAPRHAHEDAAVAAATNDAERRAASQSLGTIVGDLTRDLSTLMRQELALAKAEAKAEAKHAGKGAGLLGGAGYAAGLGILFVSLAIMWWIGDALESPGTGAIIVAVLWLVIGLILFIVGRKELTRVEPLPETVDSVKQIPDALHTKEAGR